MRRLLLVLLIMSMVLSVKAQERSLVDRLTDSLLYRGEAQMTMAAGDNNPLWLNANRYGLSSLKRANGYVRGSLERPLSRDDGRIWGLGYGVDVALAAGFTSTLVVQQAFVEGRYLWGTLTIGAKEQPMELKNQQLSSGSQTFGVNARPVPQVRLALPDYWTIPYTRDWLALKGHIAYGKTTDDGWQKDFVASESRYTRNTLYHSKAGYLKIGKDGKPLSVELGLEMACQFGGSSYYEVTRNDWRLIKNGSGVKAFLNALIPGGGEVNETTYQNAEGNQLGSWIARVNYDAPGWALSAYLDHYFEDHSAMFQMDYDGYGTGEEWNVKKDNRYLLYDFKDMMLGLELKLKHFDYVNNVVVEYLHTKYQSGPVYHDRTPAFSDHIGGLDNYYNHHIFTGWQHWGQVIGNPLYRSPIYNDDGQIVVKNNRFYAWHLGVAGQPLAKLRYRFLASYQDGLGTYDSPFTSFHYNLSLMGEAAYQLDNGWCVKGAVSMDKGRLYGDNFGVQVSLAKTGMLDIKKFLKR